MQDIDKPKEQLATEVVHLRWRIAELEAAEIERKQVEEALRKSEEKYRTVVEISPDGIAIASKGRHIFVNQSLARMFGVSDPDELLGKPVMNYIHPDYRKIVRARLEKQTKRGASAPLIEEKMIRADGTVIHVEVAAAPLEYEGEQAVLAVIRDITDRRRAEEKLRENEEKFRTLYEGMAQGVLYQRNDGVLIDVNPAALEMFGLTRDQFLGKTSNDPYWKVIREDGSDFPANERPSMVALKTRKSVQNVIAGVFSPKKKDYVWININAVPQFMPGETKPYQVFVTIHDVTERKKVEEALRESEERYRTLVDYIDLGINLIDYDHNIIMVNATMGDKFNKPVSEIIGKKCFREFEKRDAVCPHCPGVQTMATGQPAEVETEGVRDDGSRFHVRLQTFPVAGQDDRVPAFIEIAEDITERKRMEGALRASEEKYRSLVESSADSIYLVDRDCNYLFVNRRHLSRIGLKSSQVIGRAYGEFHSPEETKDFAQRVEKVLKTGKSLSYEYRSQRDNRYFIRTLSPVKAFEGGQPTAATVISKDITELKEVEEIVREREAFNLALFHYNPVETIVVDLEGRVTGFNKAKEKSGDRLPNIGDLMYKDYAGKHEIDMRAELMKCIRSGKAKEFPERRYGDRYLSITISPFSQGAIIISDDITERRRAEELLQRERDTFFAILQKAPYGVIFLDKGGESIFINTEFTHITGYTIKDIPTLYDWFLLAYRDKKYRDMVIEAWEGNIGQTEGDRAFSQTFHRAFFQSFRVTCKDGTLKEIEFRPTVLEDGGTIVMIADITERKRMHELLETAVTEWRTTFDAIIDSVCLLDEKGRIKRCNNAMMNMIGEPFSEIAGRTCWEVLYGVSKMPEGCPFASVLKTHHRKTEVILKDNRWLNISVDPLLDDEGNLVGGVHITSDITERMLAEEELQSSREQLRNLTVYLESVREQERTNIAREIHDELAQALTALKMDLSWLDNKLPRDQIPLVAKMRSMSDLIDTIIQTVKRISAQLRPGVLDDLGLVAAIEWQAEEFKDRTGINCCVAVDPDDLQVEQDRATAIFRIFQETLTNITRHAHATQVTVDLKKEAETLTLQVADNGTGITEEQIRDSKSFGLIGMRERVHPWGGQVRIKGTPGEGTRVEVDVPVGKE